MKRVTFYDHALELLEKGARNSGRKLEEFEQPQLIV